MMIDHARKIEFLESQRIITEHYGHTDVAKMLLSIKEDLKEFEKLKKQKPKVIIKEIEVDNTPYGVDWDY